MKRISVKNILLLLIGVSLIVFGISICGRTTLGIDPFNAFCVGISKFIPLTAGITMIIANLIVALIVLIVNKKYIRFATVFVTFGFGYIYDMYQIIIPAPWFISDNFLMKLVIFMLGIMILTFGVAVYMESNFGFAPYDCIAYLFPESWGKAPAFYRMMSDISFAILALIFGGPVNMGTIILAFCVGPFIDFFRHMVHKLNSRER